MAYLMGLDIGSALSKAVVMDQGALAAWAVAPTEGDFSRAARSVAESALGKVGTCADNLRAIGGCGIGASFAPCTLVKISDISCQARGTHFLLPGVRTVVEIGNQATRVIKLTELGKVADCLVSDKCAAGSGRVLKVIADVLKVDLDQMGLLARGARAPVKFTTGCAVFLETEAISRVAERNTKADIVAGLHRALAARIVALAQRMRIQKDYAATGGGATDTGLVDTLNAMLGGDLLVPEQPLITAAIGAALIAGEKAR